MAIKFVKKAAQVEAAPVTATPPPKAKSKLKLVSEQKLLSDFAGLIDEVGELEVEEAKIKKQIKALQEKLTPLKEKREELDAKVEEIVADADETGEELGVNFRLEWGKRGTKREIADMEKVKEFLGPELFMQLATVKLGDIDDYLTPPQKEDCLSEDRTTRKYKIVKRA